MPKSGATGIRPSRVLGSLGTVLGHLEGLRATIISLYWCYNVLVAQLFLHYRQQACSPEPWRHIGGRHQSLAPRVGLRGGLVDLIVGFLACQGAQTPCRPTGLDRFRKDHIIVRQLINGTTVASDATCTSGLLWMRCDLTITIAFALDSNLTGGNTNTRKWL